MIVLAFVPSKNIGDYGLQADGNGNWFYEQRVRFYDTGCRIIQASCRDHPRDHPREVGKEPYFNLESSQIVAAPRLYISRYPKKGEWEDWKTIDDVSNSKLAI